MEEQVFELIETVKAGLPVVSEQAVRALLIDKWVGLLFGLLGLLVTIPASVWAIRCWYKDCKHDDDYMMDRDMEGFMLVAAVVPSALAIISLIIVGINLSSIISISSCPDYYAVLQVIEMAKGAVK